MNIRMIGEFALLDALASANGGHGNGRPTKADTL
jgi:hypothetical protein